MKELNRDEITQSTINSSPTYQSFLKKNKYLNKGVYCYVSQQFVELLEAFSEKIKTNKKNYFFHYCYIYSLILTKSLTRGDESYININNEIITLIISDTHYKSIINNLVEWGVIEVNNSYRVGYYSKSYSINKEYRGNIARLPVLDQLILKKLLNHKKQNEKKMKQLPSAYQSLRLNNSKIKMNFNEAIKHLLTNVESDSYSHDRDSIEKYKYQDYFFSVDTFGNRAHTNLTSLSSDLRHYLMVDGEGLCQIDVTNSQPLFLAVHMAWLDCIDKAELKSYTELVTSGKYYESLMSMFNCDRYKAKKTNMLFLFAKNVDVVHSKEWTLFKAKFPTITAYIEQVKRVNYKMLAGLLQKEEAKFIIERCVDRFNIESNYSFVATIHDSIVCKEDDIDRLESIVVDEFRKLGIKPTLKKEIF